MKTFPLIVVAATAALASGCMGEKPATLPVLTTPAALGSSQPITQTEAFLILCFEGDRQPPREVKQAAFEDIEQAAAGGWRHVVTGESHEHLVSFQIPEATGPKRFRELRTILPALHAAFDQPPKNGTGQVNLPALAATVQKLRRTNFPCRVAIYGDPRYLRADQAAFTHDGPNVTKDKSVGHPHSPFQTTTKLPSDILVSWVSPVTDYGLDEKHREAIRHFNGYYVQELGGRLLRTTDDPSLLFDFTVPAELTLIEAKHDTAGKYAATERTEAVGDEGISTVEFGVEDIQIPGADQTDSPEATFAAAESDKGSIAFGINWTCEDPACDIDMYIASNGLAGELSYRTPETRWGKHFRDVTSSAARDPDVEDYQNWEWCRVDHARLHDLVLYLNVYRTTAPVRITIVRVWNGERKFRVINLSVNQGDGGSGVANRQTSSAWHRVAMFGIAETDEGGLK